MDAYKKLGDVITKLDAVLAAATTATESDDAYQTIKTAYNDGTIADEDIQTNVIAAYDAIIPVIKSQTAVPADFTFAIRNQSFEYGNMTGWTTVNSSDTGVRETSNPTYATEGTDGNYLFNTWWKGNPITQTVEGLPNGKYKLTVSVASDGGTIYLLGNNEHNEGIETGGTHPSKDVMQETSFIFLVEDGTATIGVVGSADGTAGEHLDYVEDGHWWYKADNFRLEKIDNIYVDVTVTAGGALNGKYYATYSNAEKALDFSAVEGLTAYYVRSAPYEGNLVLLEATKVPANTAVLIEAESAKTYQVPVCSSADAPDTNQLQVANGTVGDGKSIFVLANGNKGVGFYVVKAGSAITDGKAYLVIQKEDGNVKSFISLGGDNADAISSVEAEQGTGILYNLNGQRVTAPVKGGLYIMNGKKVLVK